MIMVIPTNSILMPSRIPIAHGPESGNCFQIMMPRATEMIPAKRSQPEPGSDDPEQEWISVQKNTLPGKGLGEHTLQDPDPYGLRTQSCRDIAWL